MKKKLLYIGHSYHIKTKSTEFLINYLKEYYDVTTIGDESWNGGKPLELSIYNNNYSAIVLFQSLPDNIDKIKNDNIIFFPMYDQYHVASFDFWYKYRKLKIVNFSKTLHDKLIKWGLNSLYIKYFPEPKEFSKGKLNEVFFWQRLTHININTIIPLFKNYESSIHIHKAIDPYHTFTEPSKEDEEKYNITYSKWFETREEMNELIKSKSIYIAPREYEGIGMSFLEAMSMGKCVIANNKPTMNEYIKDGVTGYLFDINNLKVIDFSNIEEIQKNAYEYIKDGYNNWLKDRKKIIDFIKSKNKKFKFFIIYIKRTLPYIINSYINKVLQFILKIQFSKNKGSFIRIFNIHIYDTRKKHIKK